MEAEITRYKAVKNEDISGAVMDLILPMLKASGNDEKVIDAFMEIAIKAWNISIFPSSSGGDNYEKEIEEVLPKQMTPEKISMFRNLIRFIIIEKKKKYPDYLKGIKSYKCSFEDGKILLKVEALPIRPMKTK